MLTFFEESHNGFCRAFYHKKRSGGGGDGGGYPQKKIKDLRKNLKSFEPEPVLHGELEHHSDKLL